MTNDNQLLINGPVNVVRLEGSVFGINKVLYLFLDVHESITEQTQCKQYMGEDIVKYFIKQFKNTKKTLDFLFEIDKINENNNIKDVDKYREKYINEVSNMFSITTNKELKTSKETGAPRENKTILFPLVRMHYIDIRETYVRKPFYPLLSLMKKTVFDIYNNIIPSNTNLFKNLCSLLKEELEKFMHILNLSSYTQEHKIIFKIKNKYKHMEVKNELLELFTYINDNIKLCIKKIEKMQNISFDNIYNDKLKLINYDGLKMYQYNINIVDYNKNFTYINCEFTNVYNILMKTFVIFMDIYFLRRFLDKDYIKNAIVYTGADHSFTYIYQLIKHNNFKITNVSYSLEENINKLNDKISNVKDINEIYKIQKLLLPDDLYQCSNMTNFPKDFS